MWSTGRPRLGLGRLGGVLFFVSGLSSPARHADAPASFLWARAPAEKTRHKRPGEKLARLRLAGVDVPICTRGRLVILRQKLVGHGQLSRISDTKLREPKRTT